MTSAASTSVTEQLAEWIVQARYDEIPAIAIERVKERFLDSVGVQFAGMSTSAGRIMAEWVRSQEAKPESTVVAGGFKTSTTFATLANTTAGHALEFDDIAPFSGHYANPLSAASLALGERLQSSGADVILAWMVGWDVIAQTANPCASPQGNTLIYRGWFHQGFQPALGVAALAAKLMGLDVKQTRMALGNAASSMGGFIKNRGSDTKSHTAGNAAMHGVMAAELVGRGFTANEDIIDGNIGVARLLGMEGGDPDKVLDGLGTWHMASAGSTLRLHASCGAGHWSQDALQRILERRPTAPEEVESIEVHIVARLMEMLPYHLPQTGLEAKYSLEYDVATLLLDGRAGMSQYTDEMVQRPAAQALMQRVSYFPVSGDLTRGSRVVLKLRNGEHLEETVTQVHGTPADPLTEEEILRKFHECSEAVVPENQRNEVIDLCRRLDSLENVQVLAEVVGASRNSSGR